MEIGPTTSRVYRSRVTLCTPVPQLASMKLFYCNIKYMIKHLIKYWVAGVGAYQLSQDPSNYTLMLGTTTSLGGLMGYR